ncbi:MAG: uracil-DNA glycosylase [Bacteriovoracaceae bacterium]|nr:uracil-DNA glycosylase [Bacteriovoracaceae bacterium]
MNDQRKTDFMNIFASHVDHLDDLLEQQWHLIEDCTEENQDSLIADSRDIMLHAHRAILSSCRRCKLHAGRINMVYGEGNHNAEVMFVGEGPGQNEDETGHPFVGKAGQLLDKIIEAMGLSRRDVYIANIIKCRPPNNRNPEHDEILACKKFLDQQILIIEPKIIVTLGTPAVKTLLETDRGIMSLRGQFSDYRGIPLLPTYHPSYLLRNPAAKKDAWEDIQKVMRFLKE